jgi:hypothetical protein
MAVISIPLSGQVHLALGALPLLVLYAAVRYQRRAFLWTLSGALLGTGIAVAIQQLIIEESVLGRGGRTLDQVEMFQASWSGFIDRFGLRGAEQDVYLGWLVPAVALAWLVLLWRRNRWLALLAVVAILVPVLLAVGRNFPIYDTVWRALPPLRYPRVPQRLLPITELVLAGLVALACGWLLTRLRPQWRRAACAIAILLVAGDLLVLPFRASAADPDNAAYGALAASPPGRTLELPIFEPGIHFGSIYDYYEIQSQRQRPSGYSTLASDRPYDFFWRYNRLNCGAWLSGDIQRLRRLGVRYVLFQRGAYAQSQRPGAWFAWEELQRRGYRATARGESVWLFRFRGSGEAARQVAPVAEPPSDEPVLCEAWKSWTMRQRDAPMWVHGPARLDLELEAPGSTTIYLSVDGRAPERLQIDRQMTLSLDIDEPGWHVLLFQLPELFDTKPPSGLRIARMSYRPIE